MGRSEPAYVAEGLPARVRVRVEVPRWSFAKRGEAGVEFLSPVPCPFNYGSVVGTRAADGDALDALVLGPRLAFGAEVEVVVHGVVRFEDDGLPDDKLVCGVAPPSARERALLEGFFRAYAPARGALNRLRGRGGRTGSGGYHPRADGGAVPC